MIIFGRGRRITSNIGPTQEMVCSHCHNNNYFFLKRITTWFTLFFIPIFPYEWYYFLYCPTCEYGIKLDSDQIATLKPLAKLNQRLIDGRITQQEYTQGLQDLSGIPNKAVGGSTSKTPNTKKNNQTSYFDSLHSKK